MDQSSDPSSYEHSLMVWMVDGRLGPLEHPPSNLAGDVMKKAGD